MHGGRLVSESDPHDNPHDNSEVPACQRMWDQGVI